MALPQTVCYVDFDFTPGDGSAVVGRSPTAFNMVRLEINHDDENIVVFMNPGEALSLAKALNRVAVDIRESPAKETPD